MNRRDLLKSIPAGYLAGSASLSHGQSSRQSRLRSALCAYSFREQLQSKAMSYPDLVKLAADLELDGLDLTVYWFPSKDDSFLLPLRQLAYRNAVEIYSISIRTDMCKPPGAERDKLAAEMRSWIDVADKLGATHVRVFGGTVPKTSSLAEASGWLTEMLREGTQYAATKGVILGLENHGGITEKASTILEIVKAVNSPNLGVNLDTGNFNRDSYAQIEALAPHAVNVQLKKDIRNEQGEQVVADWPRLFGMLRKSGYRGYLALEYEEKDDARAAVPKLTRELNRLVRQS